MEKEINEVVANEELTTELGKVSRKTSKGGVILGIVAAASAVMFAFRKKINTRIEKNMVKKLTKKGYMINSPADFEAISEDLIEKLS